MRFAKAMLMVPAWVAISIIVSFVPGLLLIVVPFAVLIWAGAAMLVDRVKR
jgi:hypothetical protein